MAELNKTKGLMVWLSLDGNLNNKGLDGYKPSGSPSWSTEGKLAPKSLYCDGHYIKCTSSKMTASKASIVGEAEQSGEIRQFTIAFWHKILNTNTHLSNESSLLVGLKTVSNSDNGQLTQNTNFWFQRRTNDNVNARMNLYWSYLFGNKSTSYRVGTGSNDDKWHHYAIVCDGEYFRYYKDGVVGTAYKLSDYLYSYQITGSYSFGGNAQCYLQDFRLYSYALSSQEIKELSRGKIGHWLCDWNGTSLPNLITGNYSVFKTSTGETKTGTISSIPAATILANKGKTLCFSMRKYSKGARTNGTSMFGERFGIHWNCKYTRSGKASQQYYPMASLLTDASDGIVYCTWTIPSDLVSVESDLSPAIQAHGSSYARPTDAGVTWYITDVKLEWGTMPSLYSASNQAFLSDISGFGRHGQVVGNVTLAGDTPRYDKSLKYNGGNVVVTGLPTMSTYTISWWDKFPADTGLLFDWRLGPVDTTMSSSSADALIDNNRCYFKIGGVDTGYQNYSNYDITANTWYYCCLVCDDSKSRLYINGIQKWEANKGSIADFSQLILGGRNVAANDGYQYTGQHSDFRIYATALSADDVKELYSLGH